MTEITASLVKDLREKTGAGMMDCKKALNETNGDFEAAVDWLRKKGLASAAKKAGRAAAEGLVAVKTTGTEGIVVELNAETDFVSRNEQFQNTLAKIADAALKTDGSIEAVSAVTIDGKSAADTVTDLIASIGENMSLRRSTKLNVKNGVVVSYIHNALKDGMGKIGVLVALESEGDKAQLQEAGRLLAMHIAAARPQSLRSEDLDKDLIARERAIHSDQARASGKPEEIIEKMVEGRLRKFYEEVCLLDQTYVIDNERKVAKVVEDLGKTIGSPVTLTSFVRLELGEGVEKKEDNFAEEVKKMTA